MDKHKLVLPTRETVWRNNTKAYVIRCTCGWSHEGRTFDLCAGEFGKHKRAASS